jgi:hypothetical protein
MNECCKKKLENLDAWALNKESYFQEMCDEIGKAHDVGVIGSVSNTNFHVYDVARLAMASFRMELVKNHDEQR